MDISSETCKLVCIRKAGWQYFLIYPFCRRLSPLRSSARSINLSVEVGRIGRRINNPITLLDGPDGPTTNRQVSKLLAHDAADL